MNTKLMLRIQIFILFLLFSFSLQLSAGAADRAVIDVSDEVRHSLIVCAEGDAGSTGRKSLSKKWRSLALREAEAAVLARARTFLDEKKRKHRDFDYQLSGVRILNKKEIAQGDKGSRRMWIEAEVPYTPMTLKTGDHRQQAPEQQNSDGMLDVCLWTDPGPHKDGTAVTVYFQGNRDFYGRIVRIGSRSEVEQLLPNVYRQTSLFKGGVVYRIPDEGDRFKLTRNMSPGTERWVVYATPVSMGQINMKVIACGRYQYRGKMKSFERSVRCGLCQPDGRAVEFYEEVWKIQARDIGTQKTK